MKIKLQGIGIEIEIGENPTEMDIEGKEMYWFRWSPFQGVSYICLSPEKKAKGCPYPDRGEFVVAEVQRHSSPEVHFPKLMQYCPYSEFNDGFNFRHPSGSPNYSNHNATAIPA